MDIINLIYMLPNSLLFLVIFIILAIFSAICIYVVEKVVPLKLRYLENQSIGYVGATLGVIYAVLTGFIIIYVMDNFQKASDITRQEAGSAAKIYRNATQLSEPESSQIQQAMRDYVNTVINTEWPVFINNKKNDLGENILNKLTVNMNAYVSQNNQDLLALRNLHNELDELYKNRAERIDLSNAALPGDLWVLVIISTLLTLFIKALTGTKFRLHVVMQMVVTLMLASILFLIIVLDRPFRGYFSISSASFQEAILDMKPKSSN